MTEEEPQMGRHEVPKKKMGRGKKILLISAGAVVALVAVGVLSDEDTSEQNDREPAAEQEDQAPEEDTSNTVSVGETGNVGDLEVTVESIESAQSYGDQFTRVEPNGEFQVVALTVENTGDESATFDDSSVTLVDGTGAQHSTSADTMLTSNEDLFLQDINPGNNVSGEAVFDVPVDTVVDEIEVVPFGFDVSEPLTVEVE